MCLKSSKSDRNCLRGSAPSVPLLCTDHGQRCFTCFFLLVVFHDFYISLARRQETKILLLSDFISVIATIRHIFVNFLKTSMGMSIQNIQTVTLHSFSSQVEGRHSCRETKTIVRIQKVADSWFVEVHCHLCITDGFSLLDPGLITSYTWRTKKKIKVASFLEVILNCDQALNSYEGIYPNSSILYMYIQYVYTYIILLYIILLYL